MLLVPGSGSACSRIGNWISPVAVAPFAVKRQILPGAD
jgi:hypothetical protein